MSNSNPDNTLTISESPIPGLYVINLVLHGDNRGWFKENYQKAKMEALGLPKFNIVQNNFSYNEELGVTRGIHAEPWEKFISVANGKIFGAWVDLRKGPSFGTTFSIEITPDIAVFVPRGVANGYQTLTPNVTYTYLVNEHWSPEAKYTFVNLFDPDINIQWPINKKLAIISDKDATHPLLKDIKPMEV
jgi:dTDP-4-dehydrorhamnose 3,5-epimerase